MSMKLTTVLLEPKNLGSDSRWCESTRILIFQHSRPGSFANRLDNRRTWMNYIREYRHIKAIFVVGIPSGEKSDLIQSRIEREHELYGDILQVDYVEHANNNTLKVSSNFSKNGHLFSLREIFEEFENFQKTYLADMTKPGLGTLLRLPAV